MNKDGPTQTPMENCFMLSLTTLTIPVWLNWEMCFIRQGSRNNVVKLLCGEIAHTSFSDTSLRGLPRSDPKDLINTHDYWIIVMVCAIEVHCTRWSSGEILYKSKTESHRSLAHICKHNFSRKRNVHTSCFTISTDEIHNFVRKHR